MCNAPETEHGQRGATLVEVVLFILIALWMPLIAIIQQLSS